MDSIKFNAMKFPFQGKTREESSRIVSSTWNYSIPLLLKLDDGKQSLSDEKIQNFRSQQSLRFECLPDGRVFSLDKKTSNVFFDAGYVIDPSYHIRKN